MSAFGPKRTSLVAPHMSAFGGKADIVARARHPRRKCLSLRQRVHDHRPGQRRGLLGKQGRQILLDPRERTSVWLFGSGVVVEDTDRRRSIVWRIHHIVGHKAWNITDDRNSALFDPASQLFGHASLCLAL